MCHDTDQHQKHPPELTIHTTPPLHNDVNLSQPPKIHISDPTRDNAAKGRHRRNKHGKKNDNAPIVEGPIPPPELLEQATSGGYATTGSDSNGTSGDDTKITEAETQDQPALTDGTQTALWALGNQLENLGLSSVPPFQQMLEVTQTVKPLTQQFLEELLLIDLGFEPPQAPAGGDELERTHRQAASIEDHAAREVALRQAMVTDNNFLAQLHGAETSYRTFVETLEAPLRSSYEVGQAIKEALTMFDDIMIHFCTAMLSHAPVIHLDVQLGIQKEGRRVRELLETDLFADKEMMAEKRKPIHDVGKQHERRQQQLSALYHLMEATIHDRASRAHAHIITAAETAFNPTMLSVYESNWTMATAATMREAKKHESQRASVPLSPFHLLPPYIRATGPHQGLDWWKILPDNESYDFLEVAQNLKRDPANVVNGEWRTIDPDKHVRCILYNWDANIYNPGDVTASLSLLNLPIIDELIPREGQHQTLLDVRFSSMTPLLWEMLKLKSGFIEEFHCSIRLAVGEDDDTAHLHGWVHLTHMGRSKLSVRQIPHELERLVFDMCGVEVSFNTEKLDNNWLPAITGSGRFDIAIQRAKDWKKLQRLPHSQKYFAITKITGVGEVLQLQAGKGELAIAAAMGEYRIRLINMPSRSPEGPFTRILEKHNITLQGFMRKEKGNRSSIVLGFDNSNAQMSASILFSRRKHPTINYGQTITATLEWDVPKGCCIICYHPDNPAGFSTGHSKRMGNGFQICPNKHDVCFLCHKQGHNISSCGYEYKYSRVATQEHFVINQTAISEGALASLGGVKASRAAASHASAASRKSSSNVRKFLSSDEGRFNNAPNLSLTLLQTKTKATRIVRQYPPATTPPPSPNNSHRVDCRCSHIITASITLAGIMLTIYLSTTIHSTLTYINLTTSLLIHSLARILCLATCAILQLIHILLTGIRHCGTHLEQYKATYSALMTSTYLVQEWYFLPLPCRMPLYLQYTACALNLLKGQLVIFIYVLTPLACLYTAAYVTCYTLCSKRHRTLTILIMVLACLAACSHPSREATTTNPRLLPLPLLHLIRPTSKPPTHTSINPCSTHSRVNLPIPDPRRPISPSLKLRPQDHDHTTT